jgi:hypothetical protein
MNRLAYLQSQDTGHGSIHDRLIATGIHDRQRCNPVDFAVCDRLGRVPVKRGTFIIAPHGPNGQARIFFTIIASCSKNVFPCVPMTERGYDTSPLTRCNRRCILHSSYHLDCYVPKGGIPLLFHPFHRQL